MENRINSCTDSFNFQLISLLQFDASYHIDLSVNTLHKIQKCISQIRVQSKQYIYL